MKTLCLSLIFVFLSGLFSALGAQSQGQTAVRLSDSDKKILQAWLENVKHGAEARIENDILILPQNGEPVCAFIRTYQVKREFRGSDVTYPAGYTTCVPAERFTMKSTVEIRTEPAQRAVSTDSSERRSENLAASGRRRGSVPLW